MSYLPQIDDMSDMDSGIVSADSLSSSQNDDDYSSFKDPLEGMITSRPNVMFGEPCIDGTRITVKTIVDLIFADKITIDEIITEHFTHINRRQVLAALNYYYNNEDQFINYNVYLPS